MKLVKIESLCRVHESSWSYVDQLIPIGSYKLFYDNGETIIQDYLLTKDVQKVDSIKKVIEFSDK